MITIRRTDTGWLRTDLTDLSQTTDRSLVLEKVGGEPDPWLAGQKPVICGGSGRPVVS